MDYKITDNISLNIQLANIGWCTYNGFDTFLCLEDKNYVMDYQKIMLKISIKNLENMKSIDFIDIYNHENKIILSYKVMYDTNIKICIPIELCMIDEIIQLVFIKKKTFSLRNIFNFFSSEEDKYSITTKIPKINTITDDVCSICIDEINDKNLIYIGNCNHIFHMKCMIDYIEYNKLFEELDDYCKIHCKHPRKNKKYICPLCRI
jgi:hypothetical protein